MNSVIQEIERDTRLVVDDVLDDNCRSSLSYRDDHAPFYPCNKVNMPLCALPTIMATIGPTVSETKSPALVKDSFGIQGPKRLGSLMCKSANAPSATLPTALPHQIWIWQPVTGSQEDAWTLTIWRVCSRLDYC